MLQSSSASVELSVPPGGRFSPMAPFQKTHSHFNRCSFTDPWDISSTFRKALANNFWNSHTPLGTTHSAGSQHWASLGTSRGTWPRTPRSAFPAVRCPTAAPHIHSSRWALWLSTLQSCVGLYKRWGKLRLARSSYRHEISERQEHM